MKTLLKISSVLLILATLSFGGNDTKIYDFLVKSFADKYQIDETDVYLKINHLPDVQITNYKIQLVNKQGSLSIGFNRSTIQLIKNNRVQSQHQVTYSAKIEKQVPVLTKMVKYGEAVESSDLIMEKRMLKSDYNKYYTDTEIGEDLIAKVILREGEILKKSDVRIKPAVHRGQPIDLRVKSGNILIEMEGIAKEDGTEGEKIRVYNQTTRKHYFGIVESPQLVVINLD